MSVFPTFFGKQKSKCKVKESLSLEPTELEIGLSNASRPGLRAGGEIKQILNPGFHRFNEDRRYYNGFPGQADVCDYRAEIVEVPKYVTINKAIWNKKYRQDWFVTIDSFSDSIPVPQEDATDATLGYYGCRMLQNSDNLNLSDRCILLDFVYDHDYFDKFVIDVCGGSGIEHHSFAHVYTPLDAESGHLILGKICSESGSMQLTAFKVPQNSSVYLPGNVVHAHDRMLGRWESLISPDCNYPSAKLLSLDRSPLRLDIV